MKAERFILSVVAIIVGLIAAGIAFYLYQMTIAVPPEKDKMQAVKKVASSPTPTPNNENFLTVDSPKNEAVFDKKAVTITGKTNPKSTLIVSTEDSDQVVTPASSGSFTLNMNIGEGTNVIQITAVFPSGDEKKELRTVTYSTEDF